MSQADDADGIDVTLKVGQNSHLSVLPTAAGPPQDREMHAILEIRVKDSGSSSAGGEERAAGCRRGPGAALAEVLIIDSSKSMLYPVAKFHAAKDATVAALRLLPEGTAFAVLSGRIDATLLHPGPDTEAMAVSDPWQRAAAERAVRVLEADGGTAIGAWLDLARRLLDGQDAPIKHVLLITDGRNEHDERGAIALDTALDACDGRVICDAWGIGDGWDAEVLLRIARRLHGRAAAVREESELPRAYEELMNVLLGTSIPELRIRLTPTPGTVIRQVKQVVPSERELIETTTEGGERGAEYVTRGWNEEVRHYQVVLTADPSGRELGEDLQLAAVELVVSDFGRVIRLPDPEPILVHWTDNPTDASQQHPGVRRHQLYEQSGAAVACAYRAWLRGEDGRTEMDAELGRALSLARQLDDVQLCGALEKILSEDELRSGRVRARDALKDVDWQHLILSSAMTAPLDSSGEAEEVPIRSDDSRVAGESGGRGGPGERGERGEDLIECPHCMWIGPAGSRYCGGECGRPFGEPA